MRTGTDERDESVLYSCGAGNADTKNNTELVVFFPDAGATQFTVVVDARIINASAIPDANCANKPNSDCLDQDFALFVYNAGAPGSCTAAPSITTQPQSVSVPSGTGVRLSVGAGGTSLSYQWFVGPTGVTTTPVTGGTGTTVDVTPAATTTYWVRVTNTCGSSDSAAATVTVTPIVAASFYVVPPCRIVDTRGGGAIPGGGVKNVNVIGACLVPAGVKSIAANVTVLNPPQLAFLAMYPGPSNTLPVGVTVNFQAGQTIANNARLTVGTDGSINFRNAATAPLDFILDISGYFR